MLLEVKEVLKHSSIYGVTGFLKKGIGFIMIPVYTHYLTTADYGVLELLDLLDTVIIMLLGLRIGSGVVRYYVFYDNPQDKEEVFTTGFIFAVIIGLALIVIGELVSGEITLLVIGEKEAETYIRLMMIVVGLRIISAVPEQYLLARKQSFLYSSLSLVTFVLSLGMNILLLVVFHLGVMGIVLSMLFVKIIDTAIYLIATLRGVTYRFSFDKFKLMMAYSIPLIPAAAAIFVMKFSDRYFIREFCTLGDVGVYSLGYKFGMIISLLIAMPFLLIWNTKRFEIQKLPDAPNVYSRFFTYYSLVLMLAGIAICVLIKDVIAIMTPSAYQDASTVVPLVVAGYILFSVSNYVGLGMMITNKTKYIAYIQGCAAVVNVIGNMLLIPAYGIMGAAVSTFIGFLFLTILTHIVSQKLYSVPYDYGRIIILIISGLVVFGVSTFIEVPQLYSFVLKSLLLLLFPVGLILGGFFTAEEMVKAKKLLQETVQGLTSGEKEKEVVKVKE